MCGLVAIISRGAPVDEAALGDALAALRHRGPDAQRSASERLPRRDADAPDIHIGFGHARLSIIDINARADQPFTDGAHTLVYNGEAYNFRELAADLRREGASFRTSCDTEILLKLLMRDGVEGLAQVNGMWSFLWLDRDRARLTAARDRYGKKPLFYAIDGDRIGFASEIEALLAAMRMRPALKDDAASSFLAEGWLFPRPDGATHLEGVREVRPGAAIEIDLRAWTIRNRIVCAVDTERARDDDLGALLADAVGARLVADRKVGLLLSGGVDSSLILSILAAKGWLDQVVCITGDAGKSEDARYARACLAALGKSALEIPLDYGGESVEQFLHVCRRQEKPFPLIGNVLGMARLYAAIGDEDIRVVLDGTGGDEIFGGYWTRYAGFAMRDAARAADDDWLRAVRDGGALPDALSRLSDEAARHAATPVPSIDSLRENEWAALNENGRAHVAAARPADPLVGFDGALSEALALDSSAGRMQEWLWQNDRNAMASSVENRSPFLDHRLAGFVRTPYHAKLGGRWNKLELRELFQRFTPLPTATRAEKQGFRWVYGRFLRNNRARLVDLIRASRVARRFADLDLCLHPSITDDALADSRLVQRLLPLAGLEAAGKIA